MEDRYEDLEDENRSIVVLASSHISSTDLTTAERCTCRGQGVTDNEAEHHGTEQSDGRILLGHTKPSSYEGKKLPLPSVNPEHDQLWDAIVQVLAKIAAGLERWTEACRPHANVTMRNGSQNKVSNEIGDEAS